MHQTQVYERTCANSPAILRSSFVLRPHRVTRTALPARHDPGCAPLAGGNPQSNDTHKGAVPMAADVGIRELLEAGVHFGHQTRRWNPKMRRFIWGERAGIYIIDLLQTERLLRQAQEFVGDLAARGGSVPFSGAKKQARDPAKGGSSAPATPHIK